MTSKFIIAITISLVLVACGQTKIDNTNSSNKSEKKELAVIQIKENIKITQTESVNDENSLVLKFNEFEITIDSLDIWDDKKILQSIQKDTAIVYLELGETIQGKIIKLIQKKEGTIRIYQRFENSITIMNEGPHCDLTGWKHYNSKWEKLIIKDGKFLTNSYTENDWKKFIEIDITELREAVKKQCGEGWEELIKDIKSPTEYPSGVSTNRIFLKFEFIDKETNKLIEKIISFEIPMGC